MNIEISEVGIVLAFMMSEKRANRKGLRVSINRSFFIARDRHNIIRACCDTLAAFDAKVKAYKGTNVIATKPRPDLDAKPPPAGLALVGKRIDKAVKRAEARAAKPKRPTAAALMREANLKGVWK